MTALPLTLALALAPPPAAPAPAPTPAPAGTPAPPGDAAPDPDQIAPTDDGAGDVTYYQFSGLGIDGELRTPALLQFLSRIGGEFETVGIPHRSFLPELQQTVMEDAL
jgi:hypothetical protein